MIEDETSLGWDGEEGEVDIFAQLIYDFTISYTNKYVKRIEKMNAKFELLEYDPGALYVIHRMKHVISKSHWHREIEIVYLMKGEIDVEINNRNFSMAEGQILLVNNSQIHAINSMDNVDCDLLVVQLNEELLKNIGQKSQDLTFTTIIDSENDDLNQESVNGVFQCLDKLANIFITSPVSIKQVNMLCMMLSTMLVQNFSILLNESKAQLSDKQCQLVKKVIDYIETNYSDSELNQIQVAAELDVSATYLSRIFSSYTHTSFTHYLNSFRINHACSELLNTNDKITDIYLRNGFSSVKTFNRVFKDNLGVNPTFFRKNIDPKIQLFGSDSKQQTSVGSYISYSDNHEDKDALSKDYLLSTQNEQSRAENETAIEQAITIKSINSSEKLKKPYESLICTGRAYDLLLAPWREQFEMCLKDMHFKYIRFHGLFDDEMGIIHKRGDFIEYNFYYVDKAFEYILAKGVKPYVELSFMPTAIGSGADTVFAYKANITMPSSIDEWKKLLQAFIAHMIEHFGRAEVLSWYFDVWNEPDINEFWSSSFEDYLTLYSASYRTIKKIDSELRVGGPSGSSVIFQEKEKFIIFLDYCKQNFLSPDFVSMHPYPVVFRPGTESYSELQIVCPYSYTDDSLTWVKETLENKGFQSTSIHMNEWNSSPRYNDYIHDTAYMATYVIDTALKAADKCDILGWWTISDLFDEGGIVYKEFGGGFGLLNRDGLKKPSYWGMWAIHRLGDNIIEQGDDYIVTTCDNGKIVALFWNYVFFKDNFALGDRSALKYYDRYSVFQDANNKRIKLTINALINKTVQIDQYQFSRKHGSVYDFWLNNGAMEYMHSEDLKMVEENNHLKHKRSFKSCDEKLAISFDLKKFDFALIELAEIKQY